jgi:hypothetical protein
MGKDSGRNLGVEGLGAEIALGEIEARRRRTSR